MAKSDKKKTSAHGKNRRDAHGVYQRRAERGKAAFRPYDGESAEEFRSNNGRNTGRTKRTSGNAGGYGSSQRNVNSGSYSNSQRDRNSSSRPRDNYKNTYRSSEWDSRSGSFAEVQSAPAANLIAGRNPVIEAIKSGREIEKIYMAAGAEGSVVKIRAMAKDAGIVVDTVPRVVLDRMAPGEKHQGVAAEISAYSYSTVEEIMNRAADSDEPPFIMVLDEISDPHNLGAIIRTAECANAHGVIIPKRNACGLTSTVAKTSAGALERMPVARVTNISRTIEELQTQGVWVAAVDMDGKSYYETEGVMKGAIALVIGNEGKGISRLVKEKCDLTISIPMKGSINSLNASNAAAIMMYAVRRSRDC